MYPILPNEHLVENRTCKQCNAIFPITDKDMEFYVKVSPTFGGRKYQIPQPTLCPDCRAQRRLAFRNERKLYKRKCDATGKEIISIYSPDKPYTVYHQDYWWSDKWDPMSYGREFDFSRSAMEQMEELGSLVPRSATFANISSSENSDYSNHVANLKDCYFVFAGYDCENCYFCNLVIHSQDSVDCTFCSYCQDCYECVDSKSLTQSSYCYACQNGNNLIFCNNCDGCTYCFGSNNLQNKSYFIFNKKYSPEEYTDKLRLLIKQYMLLPQESIYEVRKNTIFSHLKIIQSENCFGDSILNSKNCFSCFDIQQDSQNLKYCTNGGLAQDVYDSYGFGAEQSLSYETIDAGLNCSHQYFSLVVHNTSHVFYSQACYNSSYLFGCIGLRNKSYCILNKQYAKEEYEVLVPRIIEKMISDGEWGEFFPASLSPFGYNETVAQEYFPLTREEVLGNPLCKEGGSLKGNGSETGDLVSETTEKKSSTSYLGTSFTKEVSETFLHGPLFNWSDYEAPFPTVSKVIPASKLPDTIEGIPDDVLNWAIECEVSGRPFRIIKQELEFYRKHNIPIPKRHPDVRHMDRMKMRNPRKLFERYCDCPNCEENNGTRRGNPVGLPSISVGDRGVGFGETEQTPLPPLSGGFRKKMITTYAPERKEKVYCEVCYEKEVLS